MSFENLSENSITEEDAANLSANLSLIKGDTFDITNIIYNEYCDEEKEKGISIYKNAIKSFNNNIKYKIGL